MYRLADVPYAPHKGLNTKSKNGGVCELVWGENTEGRVTTTIERVVNNSPTIINDPPDRDLILRMGAEYPANEGSALKFRLGPAPYETMHSGAGWECARGGRNINHTRFWEVEETPVANTPDVLTTLIMAGLLMKYYGLKVEKKKANEVIR